MKTSIDLSPLRDFLLDLQDRICAGLEAQDGEARFVEEIHDNPGGGHSRPRVLAGGPVIEKAAVHFSHTVGAALPPAATERRPELTGAAFEAVSVSLIVHPRNPYAPTTHANLRAFVARPPQGGAVWWVGGGFDLTPYYGFVEDAVHWHRTARAACAPFGDDVYARLKAECDRYFHLPHRGETRGVGGLFFDDLQAPDWDGATGLWRSVGEHFLPAYLPILERRADTPYGERERDWQLVRRGRYVEFNLLYDRGTRFGLQVRAPSADQPLSERARRRVESILASLPSEVRWEYGHQPEPGSPEAALAEFLRPRNWLAE